MAIDNDIATIVQQKGLPKRTRGTPTKLEEVLAKGGGAYKTSGFDSVFFRVYTNAVFHPVKAERRDLTVGLSVDAPPNGAARDSDVKKRIGFWEHSRFLQSGSLVALVVIANHAPQVYLGTTSSTRDDIAESSKASEDRIEVRITFFDPEVELLALRRQKTRNSLMFLIDNDVMYEASRPFLETLQTIEPTEIPFARYLAHGGSIRDVEVQPPKYATAPRFRFKLSCLARSKNLPIQDLDISQAGALAIAREQLLECRPNTTPRCVRQITCPSTILRS